MDMKKVIEEFYMFEAEDSYHEAKTKMLSIAVDADHASMLRAVAERFGKSLSAFAADILENAVKESFLFLTPDDRQKLAEKADKETSEYLVKRGINQTGTDMQGDYEGSRHWQQLAEMMNRKNEEGDK